MALFNNLIFDWSGTLVDDLQLTLDATNYVFSQYNTPPLDRTQFRAEFQLPYPDYYARVLPHADLNELENHFRHAFRLSQAPVHVLPHAREFLEYCRRHAIRCFILSSVDAKEFALQCQELGLTEFFEGIHAGVRHKDRYIHRLLQQHALNSQHTAFIGDMQHDMHAARVAGITAIAVLTGYNDAAQLARAEPDMMVPDLAALRRLMERAASSAPHDDIIQINGLRLTAHIGVPEQERAAAQELKADIRLHMNASFADMADTLEHTVCYDSLAQTLQSVVSAKPRKLIETLANDLAAVCKQQPGVKHVQITLYKFILPQTDNVAVQVFR